MPDSAYHSMSMTVRLWAPGPEERLPPEPDVAAATAAAAADEVVACKLVFKTTDKKIAVRAIIWGGYNIGKSVKYESLITFQD